ncbi:single-stranded DNA-binding protein [Microbacteriaceae bacterium VKM Ac-2854]|nr:single-stranded DNA-binding protein [Microbacteriaceae bacterium VKM Ac-2854]
MTDTVTLVGVIGTDPKRIDTAGGVMVSFRLVSSQRRFDRTTNKWVDGAPNWYSVNVFRELAKNALASFARGDRVLVAGRLSVRPWEAGPKSGTDVVVTADALGHDLTWGTSSYTKAQRSAAPEQQPDRQEWAESGASTGSAPSEAAWSPPGIDFAATVSAPSLNSDETPF